MDWDLQTVSQSKPLLFSKVGFEIKNIIALFSSFPLLSSPSHASPYSQTHGFYFFKTRRTSS